MIDSQLGLLSVGITSRAARVQVPLSINLCRRGVEALSMPSTIRPSTPTTITRGADATSLVCVKSVERPGNSQN